MSNLVLSALLDDASALNGGAADFGPPTYLEGLGVLLRACESEAGLHAMGRSIVRDDLVRLLSNRLKLQQWRRAHPHQDSLTIAKPIFIVGLPRTGTTLLQNLLSLDAESDSVAEWQANAPCPPKGVNAGLDSQRMQAAQMKWEFLIRANPAIKAIHNGAAESVAECQTLMTHEFRSFHFSCLLRIPSYVEWLNACDMRPAYEYHKMMLQSFQSASAKKHWILKSPSHIFSLNALLSAYPDARIVVTHRDPARVVPSFVSLLKNYHILFTQNFSESGLSAWCVRQLAMGLSRLIEARQSMPPERFVDVQYQQLMRDPVGTVKDIYRHFNASVSLEHEAAMTHWLAMNPQNKHGMHVYSAVDLGWFDPAVKALYSNYVEAFSILRER